MADTVDAPQYFGLTFQNVGGDPVKGKKTKYPERRPGAKKPKKTNRTISPEAERSQKMNTTNRSRKTGAGNGNK